MTTDCVLRVSRVLRRSVGILLCAGLISSTAPSAKDARRFTGTWQEIGTTGLVGLGARLVFRRAQDGGVEEQRGPAAQPIIQPIRFGDQPHRVPGLRTSQTWRQSGPGSFVQVLRLQQLTILTRSLRISADGSTLVESIESGRVGDRVAVTTTYARLSGERAGLVGTWTARARTSDTPMTVSIEPLPAGLRITLNPAARDRVAFDTALDGRWARVEGAAVLDGTIVRARHLDDSTIEIRRAHGDVPIGRMTCTLSRAGLGLRCQVANADRRATTRDIVLFERVPARSPM